MNGSSGMRIVTMPEKRGEKQHHAARGMAGELVWMAGLALVCAEWFPSVSGSGWALFGAMAAMAGLLRLGRFFWKKSWVFTGFAGIALILTFVFQQIVIDGLGEIGNDLLNALTRFSGRIYLDFAVTAPGRAVWGLLPVLAMVVFLLEIGEQRGKMAAYLPLVLPVYVPVLLGIYPVGSGVILTGAGWCLILAENASPVSRQARSMAMRAALVVLCGALALGASLLVGEWDGCADEIARGLHQLRCHRAESPLPEGALDQLGAWEPSDDAALKITMTQPQKLYLRGQIYETYTGTAWLPREGQERADDEDVFYWLHESDFYGQSQIGYASDLVEAGQLQTLTVENVAGCTGNGYAPYALAGSDGLDAGAIGDDAIPELEEMNYYAGSVPQWYELQHALAQIQTEPDAEQYLSMEGAYRSYVNNADLQLTNESWSVLRRQLGEDESAKTLSQIRSLIRDYLQEHLVYDESVVTGNAGQDFLRYTLEGSGSGYSVHYATAAVLMLRYFGVPARYVEGYYLSAEEASAYQAGETIVLTQAHAHVWAEYYLPGVGFVPFEVTPGYLDDEEAEMGGGMPQDEQTYTGDHLHYAQVEQPEPVDEPLQNRVAFAFDPALLWFLLPLAVVMLGIFCIIRRKKLARALENIDSAPNREAIALRYGYVLALLAAAPGVEPQGAERAAMLNREALFSCHEMTREQRQEMDEYARQVLQLCRESWSPVEKLRYRLWECLY